MFGGGDCERRESNKDHDQREPPWSDDPAVARKLRTLAQVLEELVKREAERDERCRCSDPRHQGAVVSQARAIDRQLRRVRQTRCGCRRHMVRAELITGQADGRKSSWVTCPRIQNSTS